MARIDLKGAVIKIQGGGGNSQSITVKMDEGNLTYDEKRNIEYRKDRGRLDSVYEGDEEPLELKLDGRWDYITGDGNITIEDALKQRGEAGDWDSSDDDECNGYAVNIILEYTPPCSDTPETVTFADFRYEQLSHDLKAGTISMSGKCNVTEATAVRGAIAS